VKVFAGTAAGSTVAAYSVGQQIAIGALTFGLGFTALVFIFRVRSYKEVIALGKQDRADEAARREQEPGDDRMDEPWPEEAAPARRGRRRGRTG
jgi:hypothetical protein